MPKPRKKPNGTWTLLVTFAGNRRNLTLGKLPYSKVTSFCHHVEMLVEHVKFGGKTLSPVLQSWVGELSDRHRCQLGEIGLFDYRAIDEVGELFDKYADDYDGRSDVSQSSKTKVRSTINNRAGKLRKIQLKTLEPTQRSIRQNADPVWSDEAKKIFADFNSWQRNYFAAATWTRDNKLYSSIGIWAVKQGYCDHNPFSILPSASMVNEERNEYITQEMAIDAMDSCLSPDIRLTIAMGRFAGLRTCSEVRTMKWEHVDWDAGQLTIIDSKKKKPRTMPLFDRIRAELRRQQEFTGETRWVASEKLRAAASSDNYQKIRDAITRSGQVPWKRVRQNLRASCENDLLELFDERLVTQWIGHSVSVSRDHYQKLRPSDYQKAIAMQSANNPSPPNCQ